MEMTSWLVLKHQEDVVAEEEATELAGHRMSRFRSMWTQLLRLAALSS